MINNEIYIVGNLTRQAELRFTNTGTAVANFTVAWNAPKRDDQEKITTYARCAAWRDLAENIAELPTGKRIIIHGWLKQRSFEDRDGNKRETFEIEVDDAGPSMRFNDRPQPSDSAAEPSWGGGTDTSEAPF